MKKILFILLIFPIFLYADLPKNEEYSHQAYPYHGLSFKSVPAKDFNNTIIVGSCFYQEWVEGDLDVVKDIFPDDMTGVIFRNCNLDNVYVSTNNVIEGGTNKKIKVQNDWDDWILDNSFKPVEPTTKEDRLNANVSIDPKDIPAEKWTAEERKSFEELFNESLNP